MTELMESALGEVIIISYEGEYDKKTGTYHGNGTANLDNNSSYVGKFKHGLFHGKGRFSWPDGVIYEGDFEHGVMVGKGTYTWSDGSSYIGDIKAGKRDGVGKFMGSSKQIYEGEWRMGKRNGQGKIFYNLEKTVTYSGDWVDDLREGYGVMKYSSGASYEGEWRADKKCGLGIMQWRATDELYSGQWENDEPHGTGEHIWGEGTMKGTMKKQLCNMYRGSFVAGKREGFGTFFYMNGSQYTGYWKNNMKDGTGVHIFSDGKIFAGIFESNRMIPATEADTSTHPRMNDDISTQYALNIEDLFDRFPKPTNVEPEISEEKQVKEIERLLLKYNESVRVLYKRYSDLGVRRRQKEIAAVQAGTMFDEYSLSKVEKTIITARNLQKRLFCVSVETMKRCLRELGLVGATFHCFDVAQCMRRMKSHLNLKAFNSFYEYKRAIAIKECTKLLPPPRPKSPKPNSNNNSGNNSGRPKSPLNSDRRTNDIVPSTANTANGTRRTQTPAVAANSSQASATVASDALIKKRAAKNAAAANAESLAIAEYEANVQAHNLEVMVSETLAAVDWTQVDISVSPILDGYFDPRSEELDFDIINSQPILEREFVELLVRCVAECYGRKGGAVGSMSLYHTTYQVLAEQVLSLAGSADKHISSFYKAFYHDSIQDMLSTQPTITTTVQDASGPFILKLESLWKTISGNKLTTKAGSLYLKQVVDYFLSLCGTAISNGTTAESLLDSIGYAPILAISSHRKDYTSLYTLLDFDDFLEVICRVVASDLWILAKTESAAIQEDNNDAAANESPSDELKENSGSNNSTVPVVLHEMLLQRLNIWNDTLSV
eukprot:CAMPEP_0170112662 /NCGR_PEP_ID=MMETSP0020_2-20130122/9312_1 /TAXON_ID=98059 /ORGANISM="Dinobryon sp., Strain UTEXLB2267" /LENGTH=831 /DNA_ID=CAMNT_0010338641 /DNA_START=18 /DNA_END=2513 /DNA_ORIENTATION=-